MVLSIQNHTRLDKGAVRRSVGEKRERERGRERDERKEEEEEGKGKDRRKER